MAEYSTDILIPLPVEVEDYAVGYSMDIGGSINKVMYRTKEKLPPVDGRSQRLRVAYVKRNDIDNLSAFLKEKSDSPEHDDPVELYTTGVGGKQYGAELRHKLNANLTNIEEFACFQKGFMYMQEHLTDDELFYPIQREACDASLPIIKKFLPLMMKMFAPANNNAPAGFVPDMGKMLDPDVVMATYGKNIPHTPCALVMCGSGCAMMKIDSSSSRPEMVDYSPRSGLYLMGLGRMLTGAKTYDELMSLAQKGNPDNVNMMAGDMKGEQTEDFYSMMPDEVPLFCFGKAALRDLDTFAKEDVAAALVYAVMGDIVQFVILEAWAAKVSTVYFCGAMIDHPFARICLTSNFFGKMLVNPIPDRQVTMRMMKVGPYLGTVGAWLHGLDAQKSKLTEETEEK